MSPAFTAPIERKDPGLPRYLIVPTELAAGHDATFVAELNVAGQGPWRRSVKPWGDGRWFLELTDPICRAAGVDTGQCVTFHLTPASDLPTDLAAALDAAGLRPAWDNQTAYQRRRCAEHVFAAKKPGTRSRRIAATLAILRPR